MEYGGAPACTCRVVTNREGDAFVGIRWDGGPIQACFPVGYRLGETEEERRRDVWLLIRVLSRFAQGRERLLPPPHGADPGEDGLPVPAYLTVLEDYGSRGYYTEIRKSYRVNGSGAVSWPRTVRTQRAYPQGDAFLYLSTVARQSGADRDNYLTRIHEFCVDRAYRAVGFLVPARPSRRPSIPFDEARFLAALEEKLRVEHNDQNRALFSGMLDMVRHMARKGRSGRPFFGTHHFEYVWERLIDFRFGEGDKAFYFPRASWRLTGGGDHDRPPLEPDTVMAEPGKVFVLDAKYYRYGVTARPAELPGSASIHKQITYGEYVATHPKFRDAAGRAPAVYNAFLMPFNRAGPPFPAPGPMLRIGEARGDWKASGAPYERVQGVLLDVKWLMERAVRRDEAGRARLARLVEGAASAPPRPEDRGD